MNSILQRILDEKANAVKHLKEETIVPNPRKALSLISSVKQHRPIGIIAEIKRHSPSKGALHESVDPVAQAKQYEQAGAAAISVLTDTPFFKGSFADIEAVRQVIQIPILCKDFIIDTVQIDKAQSVGADAILLIVAALTKEKLAELFQVAKEKGLDVLVEVHDEQELQTAVSIGAELIGVNNRNLATFEVSLQHTVNIASHPLAKNIVLISESGIRHRQDVQKVQQAGASGILVGETLMKSENIAATIQELSLQEGEILQ
ncbi:MAG: indole-3-glycerol phosphate synthase TrpC [Bacillus sp. (in: firmicutes)]